MIYLTTPIYYPNDRPHIGTAYTTLVADAIARYWRLVGEEVYAVTGTDEHGLKIARAAEAHGMTPQAWVDHIVAGFHEAWDLLDLSFDDFIRTTEPRHRDTVQTLLQRMLRPRRHLPEPVRGAVLRSLRGVLRRGRAGRRELPAARPAGAGP